MGQLIRPSEWPDGAKIDRPNYKDFGFEKLHCAGHYENFRNFLIKALNDVPIDMTFEDCVDLCNYFVDWNTQLFSNPLNTIDGNFYYEGEPIFAINQVLRYLNDNPHPVLRDYLNRLKYLVTVESNWVDNGSGYKHFESPIGDNDKAEHQEQERKEQILKNWAYNYNEHTNIGEVMECGYGGNGKPNCDDFIEYLKNYGLEEDVDFRVYGFTDIQKLTDKQIQSSKKIRSSRRNNMIKSTLDTWVDPRSKVDGWKVKVLDVYPDDYAGSTTAKIELFDPEGNSQGEENIYIHRQDVKIGETYDARIDGIMAMPRIIGVPDISYDEVPSMKNVTRERYLKSALDTVKVTFDNGDTIVTDYNADVGREEIAKYYMHNYFNVGNEDEMHQVVKVEFPGNINSARVPEKADLDMAYQLEGYIESDHVMYDQFIVPVVKNLERKMKRGIFDYDKSLILWQHVADEGAKRYVKELGGPSYNVATRKEVAKNLAEYYKENYDVNGDIYNPIN